MSASVPGRAAADGTRATVAIEIAETAPETLVQDSEYRRLLGYPRGRAPEARALELMAWARAWYAQHGRPWLYAREADTLALPREAVVIEGVPFDCARLERRLREAEATGTALVAVSAGPELEAEAQRLWEEEKPDEYFFLEVYGSAVVEYLVRAVGARLCAAAEHAGLAVLPHYSPGYPEWDVADQGRLLRLIRHGGRTLPGPLEALESGMPRPKKSLLAVFGLTPRTERTRPLTEIVACETCTLPGCQFRRAPYGGRRTPADQQATTAPATTGGPGAPDAAVIPAEGAAGLGLAGTAGGAASGLERPEAEADAGACSAETNPGAADEPPGAGPRPVAIAAGDAGSAVPPVAGVGGVESEPLPLALNAPYATSARALRRWADERLTLRRGADGTTHARFRHEGSTCTDMGRAFRFEYAVRLGTRADGYPILDQSCAPAPGDAGHAFMCGYRNAAVRLVAAIAEEKPLLGRRLDEVLAWTRAPMSPSCYCEADSRAHKWRLVLETIHFALARLERALREPTPSPEPTIG